MLKNILLFLFACGIGMGAYLLSVRTSQNTKSQTAQLPKSSLVETMSYAIKDPPKDALIAKMSMLEGDVRVEARDATEPARLAKPRPLVQGERIVTAHKSSVLITFINDTKILCKENTDIALAQTLPTSIVLVQNKGTVDYSQNTDSVPLSIRVRNLLVRLQFGSITISLEDSDPLIQVVVNSGSVKIAYNDYGFVSQVNTLSKGEEMIFDSDARSATIE
ncbi:hypothetical protein COU88_04540 [Candidatus Roizmanbacteria bacterium CG10_big_fil_rev_8_21_14_0_10_39_6]|uniref:FecR protein domain-containing protein n=1 Tax=Candidatus Roizmanbacteria bacterium CG10_big_fil_rev_8_21_14_0_10_39_6 TaxID=1974853 RepID=A0A2M8KRI3_9BACT|nr:MAG: hypothetical protein COU88_04540 [Candidatus Roizmanbacteria bacterium CG10_big_fil_rev_8_21_14_0_10_39_6]